ncbi:unnamed protein product [Polarella glacialis]|uniref:Uncharacterized protein n=1 Tax=Polarella glacialis TaxID=89957 RepID=A0A813DA58_POLGL|nr:unnamed protein product [Polarella glacialis]
MYSNPSAEFYPRFQYALHTCMLQQCLIQASVEGMLIVHFSVSLTRAVFPTIYLFIMHFRNNGVWPGPQFRVVVVLCVLVGGCFVFAFCWLFVLCFCFLFGCCLKCHSPEQPS